jgi:tRNA(adenine34) deaminase
MENTEADTDIDRIDRALMARCIELSRLCAAAGELPFGSLIARRGEMIAEAINESARVADESRHAEILAIARARRLLGDEELRKCTLYSTVEPCPMCSFCIRAAGIGRVVFALGSPKMGGLSQWNILGDNRWLLFGPGPELVAGVSADDAYKVWVERKPVLGHAAFWLGYLTKPTPGLTRAGAKPRSSYSVRRLISFFVQQPQPTKASGAADLVLPSLRSGRESATEPNAKRTPV